MILQPEILDIAEGEMRTDLVPVYRKKHITDGEFLRRARNYLFEVQTLPVDFLQRMTILSEGCFEGLFGVLKYKSDFDNSSERLSFHYSQTRHVENFFFLEAVPVSCPDVPGDILEVVSKPTKRRWTDRGVDKVGFVEPQTANSMVARAKSRLSDASAASGYLSYNEAVPFIYLTIHYFEWEYDGTTGFCYHNPTSDRIVAEGLPRDRKVIRRLRRSSRHDVERPVLCSLTVIASIVLTLLKRPDITYGLIPCIGTLALGNALLHGLITLLMPGRNRVERIMINRRKAKNTTL